MEIDKQRNIRRKLSRVEKDMNLVLKRSMEHKARYMMRVTLDIRQNNISEF